MFYADCINADKTSDFSSMGCAWMRISQVAREGHVSGRGRAEKVEMLKLSIRMS